MASLALRVTRSSLTISDCPLALAQSLAYVHSDSQYVNGNFHSRSFLVPYHSFEPCPENADTGKCFTYPNALHHVKRWAQENGYKLVLEDQRVRPILDISKVDKSKYRSTCYQALTQVVAAQDSGQIIGPTGMGKTSIIFGLIDLLPKNPDFKILVSTEEKDVANQIYKKLKEFFPQESIGIVNRPHRDPGRIMVINQDALKDLSQGELAAMGYGLKDYSAWICDEVHRLPVKSRIPLISNLRPAFSWGLTATPKRSDNAHELNGAYFGRVLFEMSHSDVIEVQKKTRELGIVPIKVSVFPLPTDQEIPEALSWYEKTKRAYLKNSKLPILIRGIDQLLPAEDKVLLFADTIRLSIILRKILPTYQLVNGKMPSEMRQEKLAQFRSGETKRIIATDVWSEGVDVPDLAHVIDCSCKVSPNLLTQRAGRAARSADNKAYGHYIMLLCLSSEHLFNQAITKLEHFNRLHWDVSFYFPESIIQQSSFSRAPILIELGKFAVKRLNVCDTKGEV